MQEVQGHAPSGNVEIVPSEIGEAVFYPWIIALVISQNNYKKSFSLAMFSILHVFIYSFLLWHACKLTGASACFSTLNKVQFSSFQTIIWLCGR